MRPSLHLGLTVALLVSFERAPFGHLHEHDHDHEHRHGEQHAHWAHHDTPDTLVWDEVDHDSDACLLDWLTADPPSPPQFLLHLTAAAPFVSLQPVGSLLPAPTPQNHDPPELRLPPARSPPV